MEPRRAARTCKVCSGPFDKGLPHKKYCSDDCYKTAKQKADRKRRNGQRVAKREEAADRPIIRRVTLSYEPTALVPEIIPDIQPAALAVIQQRTESFLAAFEAEVRNDCLKRYAFMRGLTQLDVDEIWMFMQGKTRVAPRIVVPDPEPVAEDDDVEADFFACPSVLPAFGSVEDIDYGLDD